jgi:DUF4097 and DUF4098 domain-containing protein YvlB
MRCETFPTPEPIRLDLRLPSGEIVVAASDVAETAVELEPGAGPESAAAVEEARLELRNGVLRVEVPEQRSFRIFSRGASVRVTVTCPFDSVLRAEAASADVQARGRFASAEVDVASGDVELDSISGEARINSASGDVDVARVGGNARIRTASGDVAVGEAGASISIHTASGDQRVAAASQGEVTMRSASGDIWVGIRRGSGVWIDAASMSGETTSELEVGGATADEDDAPLVELRAQSMSGDIHVARANAGSELPR